MLQTSYGPRVPRRFKVHAVRVAAHQMLRQDHDEALRKKENEMADEFDDPIQKSKIQFGKSFFSSRLIRFIFFSTKQIRSRRVKSFAAKALIFSRRHFVGKGNAPKISRGLFNGFFLLYGQRHLHKEMQFRLSVRPTDRSKNISTYSSPRLRLIQTTTHFCRLTQSCLPAS